MFNAYLANTAIADVGFFIGLILVNKFHFNFCANSYHHVKAWDFSWHKAINKYDKNYYI